MEIQYIGQKQSLYSYNELENQYLATFNLLLSLNSLVNPGLSKAIQRSSLDVADFLFSVKSKFWSSQPMTHCVPIQVIVMLSR